MIVYNLTAQFPVNLEGKIYNDLERMFKADTPDAASKSLVTPFADDFNRMSFSGAADEEAGASWAALVKPTIPRGFDETVFDSAEASIKYLVLTNTWSK